MDRNARARGLLLFALISLAGAAVDLATKGLAFRRLPEGRTVDLIPGVFGFYLSRNTGAAFSILEGQFAFFVAISFAALGLLAYFSWSAKAPSVAYQAALGLVGGGVVGNLHDRLAYGHVRDFLHAHWDHEPLRSKLIRWFGTNDWPIFNVADAFICVGAVALVIAFWREERRAAARPKAEAG